MFATEHPDEVTPHPSRQPLRILVMVGGTLIYGAVAAAAVIRGWRHYELIGIFLQAVLLLPALLYGLRGNEPVLPTPLPARVGVWTAAVMGVFLIGSAIVSAANVRGVSNPDEGSYRFQARILGAGKLTAAPPPGAAAVPWKAPLALNFNQHILWRKGWFSKYPLGWPLALAAPERLGLGWAVNPLFGVGILIFTARIARALSRAGGSFLAVALLVLSPCFLVYCAVPMSHAMAGLLLAGACWAWMVGTRSRRLACFALMYLLIGLMFHVRPFTALLTAVTLTGGAILTLWHKRGFLARVLAIGAALGALAMGSVLLYNRAFTGDPWLSPYALWRGTRVPSEISASVPAMLLNLTGLWRTSAQSELLFSFPLIFVLAAIGFWKNRRNSHGVWLLLSLFLVIVLGHLAQTEGSSSILGERYWFEGYFAVAILAALGIAAVTTALRSRRRALIVAGCSLVIVQAAMTVAGSRLLFRRTAPAIAVADLAARYRDCGCVVFFRSSPPIFLGGWLNLNDPDWEHASVFYAVDPGPGQRIAWARTLGRDRWVVLGYDPARGVALQVQ